LSSSYEKIFISDLDECIVRCDLKWIEKIKANYKDFGLTEDFLKIPRKTFDEREIYHLNKNYNLENIEKFEELYYEDETFYDDIEITPLGEFLIELVNTKGFKVVVVSTSKFTDDTVPIVKSKKKFLNKYFKDWHIVDSNKKKIDIIRNYQWFGIIEDSKEVIHSVCDHYLTYLPEDSLPLHGRELLMPPYGWNIPTDEEEQKFRKVFSNILYLSPDQ